MLNKKLIEFELGAIESVHKRTLTMRIIAVLSCSFVLMIALALNKPLGIADIVICGSCALAFLSIAFWIESEVIGVFKLGIAIGRKQKIKTMKWSAIKRLTVEYSLSENPNAIFKVILTPHLGKEFSFDMNWANRKPLLETIARLIIDEKIEYVAIIKTGY